MPVVTVGVIEGPRAATVLWRNLLTPLNILNGSTPIESPRVNVTDPATWSYFSSPAASNTIQADLGTDQQVDSFGISAHNLASNATSFTVQYSTDSIAWSTAVPTATPTTDDDLFYIFQTYTARYWRFIFFGANVRVGVIFLGKRLVFPHAPTDDYVALHHGRKYTKLFNDSVKGHFLGNRVMAAGAETEVDMGFMDRAFTEGPLRGFEAHYNQGGTFFYASCPASIPLDMGYCRALGDDETMDVAFIEADKMSNVSFGVRSFVGV